MIASDSTGNIYKTVYLQDATSAVAIAVDTTKLYLRFKGEEMFIDVTGLYAGKYNGLFRLVCAKPTAQATRPRRCPARCSTTRPISTDSPPEEIDTIATTLARIKEWGRNQDSIARYVGQLVRLDNVAFEGAVRSLGDFGTSSNRSLIDGRGNSITVRSSAYAAFAQMTMPAGTGSVAILSYWHR